jgi:hypothetical protein
MRYVLVAVLLVVSLALIGCSGAHLRYTVTNPATGIITEAVWQRQGAEDIEDVNVIIRPDGTVVFQFSKAKATGGEAVWIEIIKKMPVPQLVTGN